MYEYERKILDLKKNMGKYKNYRFGIYGTGINAKRVIDALTSYTIVSVLDQQHEGEVWQGKKVIALEEITEYQIDAIIIAATYSSTKIIYNRIIDDCMKHNITIFDMMGNNLIDIYKKMNSCLTQKFNLLELKKYAMNKKCIYIPVREVMASFNEEDIWKRLDRLVSKELGVPGFYRIRKEIQKHIENGNKNTLSDWYINLSNIMPIGKDNLQKIYQYEQLYTIEALMFRKDILEFIRWCISVKKSVSIIFDFNIDRNTMKQITDTIGEGVSYISIQGSKEDEIIQIIRGKEEFAEKELLFLGNDKDDALLLALTYGASIWYVPNEEGTDKLKIENKEILFEKSHVSTYKEKLNIYVICDADEEKTLKCLEKLTAHTCYIEYSIVVVGTFNQDFLKKLNSNINGLQNIPNLNDETVRHINAPYCVLMDTDCIVHFNWLYQMVLLAQREKEATIICAKQCEADDEVLLWNKHIEKIDMAVGGCFLLNLNKFKQNKDGNVEVSDIWLHPDARITVSGNEIKGDELLKKCFMNICYTLKPRKTVLFISETIPTYDRDAGSRTIFFYIKMLIKKNFRVVFLAHSGFDMEPYSYNLRQMGVEVIVDALMNYKATEWLNLHCREISYAFLNYPDCSAAYIDVLEKNHVKTRYYGMDLHYIRLKRKAELLNDEKMMEVSARYYNEEMALIEKCDVVYYPSLTEVEIVKGLFHDKTVRQLMVSAYDVTMMNNEYDPLQRQDIMFVGGYGHPPNVDAVLWFAKNVFPQIYNKLGCKFYIVGSNMPQEIKNLETEGIVKCGYLSDDELKELYRKVRLIVIPLRYGAGVKGKVIEAMYNEVPIISTSIGTEGLPLNDGILTVADSEDDFALKTINLYNNPQLLLNISRSYKKVIETYFSEEAAWHIIKDDFID